MVMVATVVGSEKTTTASDGNKVPPLLWSAPVFSGGGYASEALNYLKGAKDVGYPVLGTVQHGDSYDHGYVSGLPREDYEVLREWSREGTRLAGGGEDVFVHVCHSEPGAWDVESGPRYATSICPLPAASAAVGRTMFETDRIPSGWEHRLNAMDAVWVPTAFHRDVFVSNGVLPQKVKVLPESVDVVFFDPEADHVVHNPYLLDDDPSLFATGGGSRRVQEDGEEGEEEPFRFVSVFKWEKRKAWDVLLRAYFEAFGSTEDKDKVELYIVTRAFHSSSDFEAAIAAFVEEEGLGEMAHLPRVRVLSGIPQASMPAMYAAMDAFVLPSRGEGWGRPHTEAMAMGLPIIATNWSGPTEFMTQDNSFPLPIRGLVPVGEGPFADHLWADPDPEVLVSLLREVAQSEDDVLRAVGERARADMVASFSNRAIAYHLLDLVNDLAIDEAPRHTEL